MIKFSKQIAKTVENDWWQQRQIQNPVKHLRWGFFQKSLLDLEANSESCQTSKMDLFAKIIKSWNLFTIFAKTSNLDVWQGAEYASELASKVKDVLFLNQSEYQR